MYRCILEMELSFRMIISWILILTLLLNVDGSDITTPKHFYRIDPNRAERLDGTVFHGEFNLNSPIQFLGKSMCEQSSNECKEPVKMFVNKNGVISFMEEETDIPNKLPNEPSQAIISPLWSWLGYGDGTGLVYYQQTSKPKILHQAKQDVQSNFPCARRFDPKTVLIATWYNMPYDPCTEARYVVDHHCLCMNTYTPEECPVPTGPTTTTAAPTTTTTTSLDCTQQSLQDVCDCVDEHGVESCPCVSTRPELSAVHDYVWSEYTDWFCWCLMRELQETCDCWASYVFEDLVLCRCKSAPNQGYCECTDYYGDSPDYCDCVYVQGYDVYNCDCRRHKSVEYCNCLEDFYAEFRTYDYSYEFCECFEAGKKLSDCLCTGSSGSHTQEYCDCLDRFQSFFEANSKTHFDIHEFCDCFYVHGDAERCGCTECLTVRALPEIAHVKHSFKRRDLIQHVLGDGSVAPWSDEYNTFQAVIIIGDNQTYVMFNYESLNIQQYIQNDDRKPAVVGFDGDGVDDHFEHLYSYKRVLNRLRKKSNVDMKGRWMYRVDGSIVQEPADC